MLDVTFCRDSRNRLSSVFASGHALAGEYGEDVVCAAVSAILQAARLGLEQYAKVPLDAAQASGEFSIRWPESDRDGEALKAIVGTAELAVEQIARQYPDHVGLRRSTEP